jgi:hypothetical protein
MHERRYGVEILPDADGEGGQHRRAVVVRMAVERFVDMLQARLHRNAVARQQGELRRAVGEALERGKAVIGSELPDRVHPGVQSERGNARAGVADLGNARGDLRPQMPELIRRHRLSSVSMTKLSHFG